MQPIYQLDEVGKILLIALRKCGKHKTFAEILDSSDIPYSNDEQVEAAIALESLGLIESVSYRLPFEVRAQLTFSGDAIATKLQKANKKTKATQAVPKVLPTERKSGPARPRA